MYQLCRVYPPCYLCKRTLYSLALGSHIVKFLTILLTPLWELCVVECVLLSVCPAVLFGNSARAYPWETRTVGQRWIQKKNRILTIDCCARFPVYPTGGKRVLFSYCWTTLSPYLLPIAHPCPTPYPTILLYYIVNTLTMYLLLYCVCCSLCLLVARSLARSALSTVPCVSLSSLGWVFVNFLTISLHC